MFDINEKFSLGDLSGVKEEKNLVPVTKGIKMRVNKASIIQSKDKTLAGLKLELRITDGISSVDPETGNAGTKFINKPMFTGLMDLCFHSTRSTPWYDKKQHLVQFKKFCEAMGIDVKNVTVNDEFFENIIGKDILVDIQHEEETVETINETTGEKERVKTGTIRERLRNWKAVV